MDEETLSTLPDFFGGGPERASQRFWIQLFPLPDTKHQCRRTSKGVRCYTSFGIFSLD